MSTANVLPQPYSCMRPTTVGNVRGKAPQGFGHGVKSPMSVLAANPRRPQTVSSPSRSARSNPRKYINRVQRGQRAGQRIDTARNGPLTTNGSSIDFSKLPFAGPSSDNLSAGLLYPAPRHVTRSAQAIRKPVQGSSANAHLGGGRKELNSSFTTVRPANASIKIPIYGSKDYNSFLWRAAACFGCLDDHIKKCKEIFSGNRESESPFVKDLEKSRDELLKMVYGNKKSELKWCNTSMGPVQYKSQLRRCLSFKPWAVIAKEQAIEKRRLECQLKDICDEPMYQYNQLKGDDELKTKYLKGIFDADKDLSLTFLGKAAELIRDRMELSDKDRYDLVLEQIELLTSELRKELYKVLWAKCLGAFSEPKVDLEQPNEEDIVPQNKSPEHRAKLMSEKKRRLSAVFDENHSMKSTRWEGEKLPELRKMQEENEEHYENIDLEFLNPLLNGGLSGDNSEEVDHYNRRAIMHHITESVKPGEGGVWETALLQNVELRARLKAAVQRIAFLESDRENIYRVVDEKIEKEAIARDLLIHKTKQKQEQAHLEAMNAKIEASKLTECVAELDALLKAKTKEFSDLTKEHHKVVQKLVKAEKNATQLNQEVLALKYKTKEQPSLWQLKTHHQRHQEKAVHSHHRKTHKGKPKDKRGVN